MTTELRWEEVKSETIDRFAWIPEYGDLIIIFKAGGSYRYGNVDGRLVKRLRRPHPWHEIGAELRDPNLHPYEKLGAIRTRPLKRKPAKKKGA